MLDPADLTRLDAAPLGDLFLRQPESFSGLPKVLAQIPHMDNRPGCGSEAPCKILQVALIFETPLITGSNQIGSRPRFDRATRDRPRALATRPSRSSPLPEQARLWRSSSTLTSSFLARQPGCGKGPAPISGTATKTGPAFGRLLRALVDHVGLGNRHHFLDLHRLSPPLHDSTWRKSPGGRPMLRKTRASFIS